jgi:hypothetical protein
MIAAAAVVLLTSLSLTTPTQPPGPSGPRYGLRIEGATKHRHPIAGESESVRWTVTNIGDRRLDDVRLDTTVPPGWTLATAPGCRRTGVRLRCELGPLKVNRPATIRIDLVARRPGHSFDLTATTSFRAEGQRFTGPTASFEVAVVTSR